MARATDNLSASNTRAGRNRFYREKELNQEAEGITPSKAIKLECKWCMGMVKGFICDSRDCKLNGRSLSPLRRIKLHCIDCVENRQEVRDCTGKLLHEGKLCYLHPYRLGHNPKRKGTGNKKGNPEALKFYQKTKTHDRVSGSKNDSDCFRRV